MGRRDLPKLFRNRLPSLFLSSPLSKPCFIFLQIPRCHLVPPCGNHSNRLLHESRTLAERTRYIGTGKLREFCFPDISGRENCASFAFPLYRDGKTARVLLSRYIGTGKLREFCFPAISGRENCASFAFPLYRDGKIARVLLSRYIGTGKLRLLCPPAISALQNCLR